MIQEHCTMNNKEDVINELEEIISRIKYECAQLVFAECSSTNEIIPDRHNEGKLKHSGKQHRVIHIEYVVPYPGRA